MIVFRNIVETINDFDINESIWERSYRLEYLNSIKIIIRIINYIIMQ